MITKKVDPRELKFFRIASETGIAPEIIEIIKYDPVRRSDKPYNLISKNIQ